MIILNAQKMDIKIIEHSAFLVYKKYVSMKVQCEKAQDDCGSTA